MRDFPRITIDPAVMGGRPCIRGLRFTVAQLLRLLAAAHTAERILAEFPFLEAEDIPEALAFAAWLAEAREEPLVTR